MPRRTNLPVLNAAAALSAEGVACVSRPTLPGLPGARENSPGVFEIVGRTTHARKRMAKPE